MKSHSVWGTHGGDTMSRNAFFASIAGVLTWGFILTYLISSATLGMKLNIIQILLFGLGIPIVGIILSAMSKNPVVSFIGFNMVVGGLSAILGPVIAKYSAANAGIVAEAAMLTAGVTAVMGFTGLTCPKFYSRIGGALFISLIILVGLSLLGIFFPALRFGWLVYVSAGVFSLYIGYDMWRASTIPATLDNAVDVAVSLYLDIINLFLDILKILSSNDD